MSDSSSEYLTKTRLTGLREKWSRPDSRDIGTWDYDGVYPDDLGRWRGYNHEMREGLSDFGCKSFDELVDVLGKKLSRKPNVIDLMGGAYFLSEPQNTNFLVGIRIHDKDSFFLDEMKDRNSKEAELFEKTLNAPNRHVVEADVLSNKGWKIIEEEGIPPADLLVCRPVGPFDDKTAMIEREDEPHAYVGLYSSLFNRMLKLVNKKGGVVFTEVPDIYSEEEVRDFFTDIDEKEGTQTKIFTVPDEDYHWGGRKRRYAVLQFGG